jgi:hypothetical protein
MDKTKRTFKTVLAEKAKQSGAKSPREYREFYDACRYVSEKFRGARGYSFDEWIKEESFFD